MSRIYHRFPHPVGSSGSHLLIMGLGYAIFALSLLFQGRRWHHTPAYHNLLILMPTGTWGALFGLVSILLLATAYLRHPSWLAYTAILAGVMLTSCWDIGFIIRWLTNGSTTPETWVSWAVFDYILLRAGALVEKERNREVLPHGHASG